MLSVNKKYYGSVVAIKRLVMPHYVVLHHSGGEGVAGAVSTLQQRGLGYHYIIARSGEVFQLLEPKLMTYHAKGHNRGSVGVCFIGGSTKPSGAANSVQLAACVEVLKAIKRAVPSVTCVTGHKHVNPGNKWDPQFIGETKGAVNLKVDLAAMLDLAQKAGLTFKKTP